MKFVFGLFCFVYSTFKPQIKYSGHLSLYSHLHVFKVLKFHCRLYKSVHPLILRLMLQPQRKHDSNLKVQFEIKVTSLQYEYIQSGTIYLKYKVPDSMHSLLL